MASKAKRTTKSNKAAWYGSQERLIVAATLRGNLGKVLKAKTEGGTIVCLSGETKSSVTKGLKKVVGEAKIEYHNPLVCRRRNGEIAPVDGTTRIWYGIAELPQEVPETVKEPEKAYKAAVKAAEDLIEGTKPKVSAEDAMAKIQELQAQIAALVEGLS